MREKIRSRLADRTGFTLAELMISMLVMLMVTSIVASGIPLAKDAMDKVVDAANARVLLSTTTTALRAKLSVATNVRVGNFEVGDLPKPEPDKPQEQKGDYVTYFDAENGSDSRIKKGGTGESIMLQEYLFYDYDNLPGGNKVGDVSHQLVSDKAATKGMTTQFEKISYNWSTHCFTIYKLQVMKDGQELAKLDSYQIRNIAP